MSENPPPSSKLDPELRKRLRAESLNPWRGFRRLLWITFFGSSCIGLLVMGTRLIAGDNVLLIDLSIQVGAFLLFGFLLYADKEGKKK